MNNIILKTIKDHIKYERQIEHKEKKDNGVFFTNEIKIIDNIFCNPSLPYSSRIFS